VACEGGGIFMLFFLPHFKIQNEVVSFILVVSLADWQRLQFIQLSVK
jgi:hypothetical protein